MDDHQYQREWSWFRAKIRILLILLCIMILSHLGLLIVPESGLRFLKIVIVVLWSLFLLANMVVIFSTCPRCYGVYFRWYMRWNLFWPPDCKNCGLKFYERSSFEAPGRRFGF